MPVKALISYRNWSLDRFGTTLSPNSEVAGMEAVGLQSPLMSDLWRTTSNDEYIDFDLSTAREIGVISLVGPRYDDPDMVEAVQPFATDDQVTISMSMNNAGDEDVLAETTVNFNYRPGIGYFVWMPTATLTARYVRIRVNAISRASDGYFDLCYIWIGPRFTIEYNYDYGDEWGINDLGLTDKSPTSGSMYHNKGAKLRQHRLDFGLIRNIETRDLKEMIRYLGNGEPFLFSLIDAGDMSYDTMLCHHVSVPGVSAVSPITNRTRFSLEEVR